jgi:hypothetical protein
MSTVPVGQVAVSRALLAADFGPGASVTTTVGSDPAGSDPVGKRPHSATAVIRESVWSTPPVATMARQLD